jgi:hypothetical protein
MAQDFYDGGEWFPVCGADVMTIGVKYVFTPKGDGTDTMLKLPYMRALNPIRM